MRSGYWVIIVVHVSHFPPVNNGSFIKCHFSTSAARRDKRISEPDVQDPPPPTPLNSPCCTQKPYNVRNGKGHGILHLCQVTPKGDLAN